jgi:hypothetical protein
MGRRKPKPKPKKRQAYIEVTPGETYRVAREGKPARHVRIVRILDRDIQQPKARYILVTRSGKLKERRHPEENLNLCWLSFRDGSWRMPEAFELVESE